MVKYDKEICLRTVVAGAVIGWLGKSKLGLDEATSVAIGAAVGGLVDSLIVKVKSHLLSKRKA